MSFTPRAVAVILLAMSVPAQADTPEFAPGEVTVDGHGYRYRLLLPPAATPAPHPLVVYLHGAGERGSDNERQLHWLPRTLAEAPNRARFPCFVLAVQCPDGEQWVDVPWAESESTPLPERPSRAMAAVLVALAEVMAARPVDPARVYLTGLSMGGYGTFDLAARQPARFAAALAVCGGGDERQAAALAGLPFSIWHGDQDRAVPVVRSRTMAAALRAADGDVHYTELPGVGHDSWKQAYGEGGALGWLFAQRRPAAAAAPIVPWPAELLRGTGEGCRLAAPVLVGAGDGTAAHAAVLAGEVAALTGIEARVAVGEATATIGLALDAALPAGGYELAIGDRVVVRGADLAGLAAGTAALLQALTRDGSGWRAPALHAKNEPAYPFAAVLVDCARHFQSPASLRAVIDLCRLCGVPLLVLHLTDHEGFRFPSRAFPEVVAERHYTASELRDLVAYADARGVTLVPELDVPGHSRALVRGRPDLFALADRQRNEGVVNLGRMATREALAVLIGEMCDVFASSPWFHLGGDEVDLTAVADDPDCRALMAREGLGDAHELYRHFLVAMHEVVKARGRRTLLWEGFARGGQVQIPKDVTVIAWESAYYRPDHLLADGYTVVNASWQPLYVVGGGRLPPHAAPRRWSPAHLYRWQPRRWEHFAPQYPSFPGIEAGPGDAVLGAMMCVWEQEDGTAAPHLRARLPAFAERVWRPDAGRGYGDFQGRAARLDAVYAALQPALADGDEWAALQRSGPARVRYRLYQAPAAGWDAVPDFARLTPYAGGALPLFRGGPRSGPLGLVLEATLPVAVGGAHAFKLESCDGPGRLLVGGRLVCDHAARGRWEGTEGVVELAAGDVELRVEAAQGFFHTLCRVWWKPPGADAFRLVDPSLREIAGR